MTADTTPVLEFASFRLVPGTDQEAFLNAAKGTETMLRARGSLIRRDLTVDSDGLWTDVVQWRSLDEAQAAAKEVMDDPAFLPFLQSIDPASATMRHASIRWQME